MKIEKIEKFSVSKIRIIFYMEDKHINSKV